MDKIIDFKSIEQVSKSARFTFIDPGEPIGHGVSGCADVAKVVFQSWIDGSSDGEQRVINASTLAMVSGHCTFAPLLGTTLSKTDAGSLAIWSRHHLARCASVKHPLPSPPVRLSIQCGASGRYATIISPVTDMSVRLDPNQSDFDCLQAAAAEWRRKAMRYEEMAKTAEAAAAMLG